MFESFIDFITNLIMQVFGNIVLPVLLPIFIASILLGGMSKPEKMIESTFSLMGSILAALLKGCLSVVMAIARLLMPKKPSQVRYPNYPDKPNYPKYPEKPKYPKYPDKPYYPQKKNCENCGFKTLSTAVSCSDCGYYFF